MRKKVFIIHLREKRVKPKIIRMCSHPKFVLRPAEKHKENELHRKYTLFVGPEDLLQQFRRYNKINDFISFRMTRSRASITYTERIAFILCMHLGACRFFMHPTALTLSYTAINEIATFTAVDENGRCNNNGI